MAGSSFGTIFKITTWGESHGKALGAVIDGCPAGLSLSEEDIQLYLNRRRPGRSRFATPRREDDLVEILSGTFEGRTTGAPISMLVRNTSQRSSDYGEIASYYRPGHADYCFEEKYGFRDYRGGGRSSGRETIGRVAAGAVAAKLLSSLGITLCSYTRAIGPVSIDASRFDRNEIDANPVCMPDAEAAKRAEAYLEQCMEKQDSSGGVIECLAQGCPAGLGDPVFEKLDARLAQAVMSVGAVKAVEIGDGMRVSTALGSENNDAFRITDGSVIKSSNHAGGILGGISDGSTILLRAAVKPTPSIFSSQETVNRQGEEIQIRIKGRHDPVIVPRAVVVVEAMTALTLADALLVNMTATLDGVKSFYMS